MLLVTAKSALGTPRKNKEKKSAYYIGDIAMTLQLIAGKLLRLTPCLRVLDIAAAAENVAVKRNDS